MPTEVADRVLSWASIIEDNTIEQAKKAAALPFVEDYVALMADAHVGFGSTVGSVIATRGAILPSAVGVDIGCVDAETECLTANGWIRMDEYDNQPIMAFDPDTESSWFETPVAYHRLPMEEDFYWFKTKYGIDQMLSGEHKVAFFRYDRSSIFTKFDVDSAENITKQHNSLASGWRHRFLTTFKPILDTKINLDEPDIRVGVMVCADGNIQNQNTNHVRLSFKKLRKVIRAEQLLSDAGIDYTKTENKGVTHIYFHSPIIDKTYSWGWLANNRQLKVISDEALLWDGNEKDSCFYTRIKSAADFMQYAMTASGYRSVMRSDEHKKDGKLDYRVFAHTNTKVGISGTPKTEIQRVPSSDGLKYCFTTSTGFWVMRRGGNVVVTGNCGMIAIETTIRDVELPDDLSWLHSGLSSVIPSGVGKGNNLGDFATIPDNLWQNRGELTDKELKKAINQFGTLGSGNHFVELCLDERGIVWLMLHSGSRGIGNNLATKHIDGAKKLMKQYFIELPDPDLAYLVENTPEFNAYIRDMLWSQEYAYENREQMMRNAVLELKKFLRLDHEVNIEVSKVNCHHNYTNRENVHGKNVWLTRKGAISAREGQLGIIPGSMATGSYIVQGLGSEASFQSCSHGAGRVMSRGQARRELTTSSLKTAMKGKAWNAKDAKDLVDEHPEAYKSIENVMADQVDLVAPVHHLTQILNLKGV